MGISRRSVLGQSAALGALAAMATQLRAAEPAAAAPAAAPPAPAAPPPTYCRTSIYRTAEGATFDADMFRDTQLPMIKKAYARSANRIELRVLPPVPAPVEGAPPAPPQQLLATVNIWFTDLLAFAVETKALPPELAAGMEKITKAPAIEQVDQVLMTMGEDRPAVLVDSFCHSTYYPSKEGGTFEEKYFVDSFYPKFAETIGMAAIRRIELTKVATNNARVMNSVHVYLRDEKAYVESAPKIAELFKESLAHTNISPVETLMRVHATS